LAKSLSSEWIPGDTNKVANSLSSGTDLSDAQLSFAYIFLYSFHQQSKHFRLKSTHG
jgi:hypothetical protein